MYRDSVASGFCVLPCGPLGQSTSALTVPVNSNPRPAIAKEAPACHDPGLDHLEVRRNDNVGDGVAPMFAKHLVKRDERHDQATPSEQDPQGDKRDDKGDDVIGDHGFPGSCDRAIAGRSVCAVRAD